MEESEMINKVIAEVTKHFNGVDSNNKEGWWSRLLDKENNHVSASSFYLISVTIVGLLLLIVPLIVLTIEVCYNHTVTTDLNGMAAYIGSVAALFVSGGIVKGWISYNDAKAAQYKSNETCCENSQK